MVSPKQPLVSIIVPAFNAAKVIEPTIVSLLDQTHQNLEILVIDDRSTDATTQVVAGYRDPRIKLIELPYNIGVAEVRNIGIRMARGDYIAFSDADDISLPARIESQLVYLNAHADIDAVGALAETFGADSRPMEFVCNPDEFLAATMFSCEFIMSSLLFRRHALIGMEVWFDPEYGANCDWELINRFVRRFRFANVDAKLIRYRRWPEQMTANIVDTIDCPATQLRSSMLEWIGIPVEEQDLAAHVAVSPCYWPLVCDIGLVDRQQIQAWTEKICLANQKSGRISPHALTTVLSRLNNTLIYQPKTFIA